MYAGIVRNNIDGLDIEMELGASMVLNLDQHHYGTRASTQHRAVAWGARVDTKNAYTVPVRVTLERPDKLTIHAQHIGDVTVEGRPTRGNILYLHIAVVRSSAVLKSHPEDEALAHNPRETGHLLMGTESKTRYAVPCRWNLHLGPGDDGVGNAIVYTDRYVRPGNQFLLPDDHVGTINGVRPVHLRATGKRVASHITITGIRAREAPASGCIEDPPASVVAGQSITLKACTHDPNVTYQWEARNDDGRSVGRWMNAATAQATYTAPAEPQLVHIALVTTENDHPHVHGARLWVVPADSDYFPAAAPQPPQPGAPANRKFFTIDVKHADATIEMTGTDLVFGVVDGVAIAAPVVNPPVGPFNFWAQGRAGTNAALLVTIHGVTYQSVFTL